MLSLQNISLGTILQDISLEFTPQQAICIPDASSEEIELLIPLLLGDVKPSTGSVSVDGVHLASLTPHLLSVYQQNVFLLTRKPLTLKERTVLQNVVYALKAKGEKDDQLVQKRSKTALDQCGLTQKLHQDGGSLSTAEKQLLEIAKVIAYDPKIVIACDFLSGIDDTTARQCLHLLEDLSSAGASIILFSNHEATKQWNHLYLHKPQHTTTPDQPISTETHRETHAKIATMPT